jgi:hypothetical protein
MWSFFSKDPSKELVNYDLQEQVQLDFDLQELSIWNLFNAKKKGAQAVNTGPGSQQSPDSLFSVFAYQSKPGNETWVSDFLGLSSIYISAIKKILMQNIRCLLLKMRSNE